MGRRAGIQLSDNICLAVALPVFLGRWAHRLDHDNRADHPSWQDCVEFGREGAMGMRAQTGCQPERDKDACACAVADRCMPTRHARTGFEQHVSHSPA